MTEITIKISDKLYEYIVKGKDLSEEQNDEMALAIADGTPLSKGHGRLIDADDLLDANIDTFSQQTELKIKFAPTIIEADKEVNDDETRFPYIEGELAEMFVDGEWVKGRIVNGYRFRDGVVTIENDDGKRYWCGQDRTELYRPFKEVNADANSD